MKFTYKQVDVLYRQLDKSPEDALIKLNSYFEINGGVVSTQDLHLLSIRESIFLDFFFNCLVFSRTAEYSCPQTASILNIGVELIDNVKQGVDQQTNLNALKDHTRQLLSGDEITFSLAQSQGVFEEFTKTLIRNYGLYLYVFTKDQEESITCEERTVEHLPALPPLASAVLEATWLQETQLAEEALKEQDEFRMRQQQEQERRRLEEAADAERLKKLNLKETAEALSPEQLTALTEKIISDFVGPLTTDLRTRLLADAKVLIK